MKRQLSAIMRLTVNLSMAERRGVIRQPVSRKASDATGIAAYKHGLDI